MDWILDNLQLVIVVAGVIAYWINQSRKGWTQSGEEDVRETRQPHAPLSPSEDIDQAEQVRRVQAEIRRKIAERRAAMGAPAPVFEQPPPPPAPHTPPPLWREESVAPPPVPAAVPAYSQSGDADSLARQRRLAEQLAEAERAKADAREKLGHIWDRPSVIAAKRTAARLSDGVNTPREILRDRKALRSAWIMREVLDKPVALR